MARIWRQYKDYPSKKMNKYSSYSIIFLIIFLSCILITANPFFSPSDDVIFKETIMRGIPFYGFSEASINQGRFNPVGGLIFNIALINPSIQFFFLITALEFAITVLLFYGILLLATNNRFISITVLILFLLSPSSTMTWMRLSLGERDLFLFLSIFVYFTLREDLNSTVRATVIFIAANLAIYTKEPVFIALIILSLTSIAFNKSVKKDIFLNLSILLSSILFYVIYILLTSNSIDKPYYVELSDFSKIKAIFNYLFFTDLYILLICIPLLAIRLLYLMKNRFNDFCVYDSLLLAGIGYVFIYMLLGIYQPYYLGPAYILLIPSTLFLLVRKSLLTSNLKKVILLFLFGYFLNILPTGVHYLTRQFYLPKNFNDTIKFLGENIKKLNTQGVRPSIFIDGRPPNYGIGEYHLFESFLASLGLSDANFDMASNLEKKSNAAPEIINWDKGNFKIYQQELPVKINSGDFLILTPDDERHIDSVYIENFNLDFNKVYESNSPFFLPMINFKVAIKYLILNYCDVALFCKHIKSSNLQNSPNYFIFQKK